MIVNTTTFVSIQYVKDMMSIRGHLNPTIHYVPERKLWVLSFSNALCLLFPPCNPCSITLQPKYIHLSSELLLYEEELNSGPVVDKVGSTVAKDIMNYLSLLKCNHVILVTDVITPHAKKYFDACAENVQHFTYDEITSGDITKHMYQPTQIHLLTLHEHSEFISRNPMFKQELFRYSVSDPLAKYYGLHVDDIVQLEHEESNMATNQQLVLVVASCE
jgi:DNA-directed RNA polymerase subunit H (RpoH/RPB5)